MVFVDLVFGALGCTIYIKKKHHIAIIWADIVMCDCESRYSFSTGAV